MQFARVKGATAFIPMKVAYAPTIFPPAFWHINVLKYQFVSNSDALVNLCCVWWLIFFSTILAGEKIWLVCVMMSRWIWWINMNRCRSFFFPIQLGYNLKLSPAAARWTWKMTVKWIWNKWTNSQLNVSTAFKKYTSRAALTKFWILAAASRTSG